MTPQILVVDDEEPLRRGYRRGILQHTKFASLEAGRAEEARRIIEAQPDADWIVVLDHDMAPREGDLVKSGLELVRYLQTKTTISARIIMTGSGVSPEVATAGGMISLPKPFEIRALIEKIQPWLNGPPNAA